MMRDIVSQRNFNVLTVPAAVTSHTSFTSLVLDTQGSRGAAILAMVGAMVGNDVSNFVTAVLQESDTTAAVDFTAVAAGDQVRIQTAPIPGGTGTVPGAQPNPGPVAANTTYKFGYLGTKRYIRLSFQFTGAGVTSIQLGALGMLAPAVAVPNSDIAGITAT